MSFLGGWSEIMLICFLAFILLKSEDYILLLKFFGKLVSKIKFHQYKFQAYLESLAHEDDDKK